eukprot:COSAG01_NODE_1551_length_9933_cov_19.737848_4_plen_89_part_00
MCLDGALIRRAKVLPSTCVCLIYAAKYINTFLIMSFTISIPIGAHKSLNIKCIAAAPWHFHGKFCLMLFVQSTKSSAMRGVVSSPPSL